MQREKAKSVGSIPIRDLKESSEKGPPKNTYLSSPLTSLETCNEVPPLQHR